MRQPTSTPFSVTPVRSRTQFRLLSVLHGLALYAVMISSLSGSVKLSLCLLTLCYYLYHWRLYQLPTTPVTLSYTDANGWSIDTLNDRTPISILPSSLITTQLIIVYYQQQNQPKQRGNLVCFKDCLGDTGFRLLLVQLKITTQHKPSPSA